MTAHLAQGQSIAYYDADNTFLGGADYPYPANPGLVYVCVSGAFNNLYQSLCAIPGQDNAIVPGGSSPAFCMTGLPMRQVDDGCYALDAVAPDTASSASPPPTPDASSSGEILLATCCDSYAD